MIETPTLFVLGAGASKPYGYPTGPELRSEIVPTLFHGFPIITKTGFFNKCRRKS